MFQAPQTPLLITGAFFPHYFITCSLMGDQVFFFSEQMIGMKHENSNRYFKVGELISFIWGLEGGRDNSIVENELLCVCAHTCVRITNAGRSFFFLHFIMKNSSVSHSRGHKSLQRYQMSLVSARSVLESWILVITVRLLPLKPFQDNRIQM